MNQQFHILDRHQIVHDHCLLEASAGTGKTFSIENLVVRLLIEKGEHSLALENILVVTFTKAAVKDLKQRIKENIERSLDALIGLLNSEEEGKKPIADYLQAMKERGDEFLREAVEKLRLALALFEKAEIFTIHSFCAKMLRQFAFESDVSIHALAGEESFSPLEMRQVIADFFRTEIKPHLYSLSQLEGVLKKDPYQKKLLRLIQSPYEIAVYPSFEESKERICKELQRLKKAYALSSERIVEDFTLQAKNYRNYSATETKEETLGKVCSFAALFDKEEWSQEEVDQLIRDGLVWVKALQPHLLKAKKSAPLLHYPHLLAELQQKLYPLVEEAGKSAFTLVRMARACRQLLMRYQREEEKLSFDGFLRKMQEALQQGSGASFFSQRVQSAYRAVIIDEFQDTDPVQWDIFRRLFLSKENPWEGSLYLVGDPKQSIYSFRDSDIYTYLDAAQAFHSSQRFSLTVNYRSDPRLIEALNTLFSPQNLPLLIHLPKAQLDLPYQRVQAGLPFSTYKTERGFLHFIVADQEALGHDKLTQTESFVFLPFIAREIFEIQERNGFSYNQFAILVRDRYQAQRVAQFLEAIAIPVKNQRASSLTDAPAYYTMIALMEAVLHPSRRGAIRLLLASRLMGWKSEALLDPGCLEFGLWIAHQWKKVLFEKGFASFFDEVLSSDCSEEGKSVAERIVEEKGGVEFLRDLQQIAEAIIDSEKKHWTHPEGIISFLDNYPLFEENEEAFVKRVQNPLKEGVNILTLHSSKGLEFEVVFALGLVNQAGRQEEWAIVEQEGEKIIKPLEDMTPERLRAIEESDAEKMRQLYVALTRAKKQLFVPVLLPAEKNRKVALGEASPMELLLARFNRAPIMSNEALYQQIQEETGAAFFEFLDQKGSLHEMSYSLHRQAASVEKHPQEAIESLSLIAPRQLFVRANPLYISSFSHLRASLSGKESSSLRAGESFKVDIPEGALPFGAESGNFIHWLMQQVTFADFKAIQTAEEASFLVAPLIEHSPFRPWQKAIAELIFNALKTPLVDSLADFCLADLQEGYYFREMEFLFSQEEAVKISNKSVQKCLMKGFIDCLFCHKGHYYLVDWKSHWLGSQKEAYDSVSLDKCMIENGYDLQASIYVEALRRYLPLIEKKPFEECFGGVFYLFLRGLEPGRKTGIWYKQGVEYVEARSG